MPIVGEGSLMVLDGDEHLDLRRALAPGFKRKLLAEHRRVVAEVVDREVASWPCHRELALAPGLRTLSLEIILRLLFPLESDRDIHTLREAILAMMDITSTVLVTEVVLRSGPRGRRRWRRFLSQRAQVDQLVFNAIDRHRGGSDGLLDLLLNARDRTGRELSDREVRDNVMSMVLAGHETTSSQLAWAFQLLAHHPNVQRGLCAEIDRGDSTPYLTATVHEVQRHRPVLIFTVPRGIVQDVQIGDWTYRPPAQVVGCTYLINHAPPYQRPYGFDPNRFLDAPPDPATWVLWGGGRRICLGRHLALAEMHETLRSALSRFTVSPTARTMERPYWRGVLITPHRGARIVLHPRRPAR